MSYKPLFKHVYDGVTYYICSDSNNDVYVTAYKYDAPFPYPQAPLEHVISTGILYLMIPKDDNDSIEEFLVPEQVMCILKEYCGKYNT